MLDAIPCLLCQQLPPVLLPSLNVIINDSLRGGFYPTVLEMAIVTPVLKSKTLDSDALNNYRPVSNLATLSKVF